MLWDNFLAKYSMFRSLLLFHFSSVTLPARFIALSASYQKNIDDKRSAYVKQGTAGWFIGKTIFVEGTVELGEGLRTDGSWFDITISGTLCCRIELWTMMDHPASASSDPVLGKHNSCFASYPREKYGVSFSPNVKDGTCDPRIIISYGIYGSRMVYRGSSLFIASTFLCRFYSLLYFICLVLFFVWCQWCWKLLL